MMNVFGHAIENGTLFSFYFSTTEMCNGLWERYLLNMRMQMPVFFYITKLYLSL